MSLQDTASAEPPDLRYPIGRPDRTSPIAEAALQAAVATLAELPKKLREVLDGLTEAQLDTPYRDGGWTVRQLVHHIADSHMNQVLRHKMGLTYDAPTIAAYDEKAWAKLADSAAPVEPSLAILDGLHARWAMLLRSMTADEWKRNFVHPERGPMRLDAATLLYAWHSKHHVAHIAGLRQREGWL